MKSPFKPYRLINGIERSLLQQRFEQQLLPWNEQHALFPLSIRLRLSPTTAPQQNVCWAKAQATWCTPDLSMIQNSLFGDESPCFHRVTETLFNALITDLFGDEPLDPIEDWFYPGTPSLTLTFVSADQTKAVYLHPQWVIKALPAHQTAKQSTVSLHQALATQSIPLNVDLMPITLNVSDILRMQIGDLIKTDHPVTEPAALFYEQTSIASVEIGESNSYKSIQITRQT